MIDVVLVDDHHLLLEGVARLLETVEDITVVGTASTIDEAVTVVDDTCPTVVLLDVRLAAAYKDGSSNSDGLTLLEELSKLPTAPVVAMMTGAHDEETVRRALRAGAKGFLDKTMASDHFESAIRVLARGGSVTSEQAWDIICDLQPASPCTANPHASLVALLTKRQRQILVEVMQGKTNRQISRSLILGQDTVKAEVSSILNKLGVDSRHKAARIANDLGLDREQS